MVQLADFQKLNSHFYTKSFKSNHRVNLKKFNTWRIEVYKTTKKKDTLIWICDGYDSEVNKAKTPIPGRGLIKDLNKVATQYQIS